MKRLELDSHSFYSLAEQRDTNSDKEIGTLFYYFSYNYILWTCAYFYMHVTPLLLNYRWTLLLSLKLCGGKE